MSAERPQREVAYRLFAAEFDEATHTYAESDEERAPNYVVAPSGARINRVFVVGVLTEVEQVSDDVVRARIVDPTGAFVVYAGQYQPEALAFFERTDPPAFVAVTGKARTFEPDDGDVIYSSIRPETANEVDADTRDRWVVQTAEHTLERVGAFAEAMDMAERGEALESALLERGLRPGLAAGIPRSMAAYGTTTGYLAELRRLAIDAARVVAGDLDEVERPSLAPDDAEDETLSIESQFRAAAFHETGGEPSTDPVASGEDAEAVPDSPDIEAEPEEGETDDVEEESVEGKGDDVEEESVEGKGDDVEEESVESETDAVEADPSADEDVIDSSPGTTGETETDPSADRETKDGGPDEVDGVTSGNDSVDDADRNQTPVGEEAMDEGSVEGLDDDDEMYELSEEEREAVEEKFDVGFETGNEVESPGSAEMGTAPASDPTEEPTEDPTEERPDDAPEAMTDEESAVASPDQESVGETSSQAGGSGEGDIDLEDAVVDAMTDLDDGSGAPRDELVEQVAAAHDVDESAVDDAIQDALMGGRCYESGDDRLTPI